MAVQVHDSTAERRYIVIPMRPEGTEAMNETELAACVTRDCLIGVALPRLAM
jgi:nitrile hydratase